LVTAAAVKDSISSISKKMQLMPPWLTAMLADVLPAEGSMGFSSMLNSNFIGIRYFNQSYSSRDGIFANSPWIDENFNTAQIWTKTQLEKKLRL
jgi:hypothetical protein